MIVTGGNFNVTNFELFKHSVEGIRQSIACPENFFCSDNMITWNRNFSFMTDKPFVEAFNKNSVSDIEVTIVWRTYVLCHFAKLAVRLPGDFVEVGAYKGNTANVIMDRLDFGSRDKTYWLYDAFEHTGTEINHAMPEHGPDLYEKVRERFAPYPFVRTIKGYVPDSFEQGFPEKVAFAHVDLNQAPAEIAALEMILPRLVSGGVLVLDDYGWFGYRAQKVAEDPLLAEWGLEALELPTGQGVVIKP
jgi:hypothetical protein